MERPYDQDADKPRYEVGDQKFDNMADALRYIAKCKREEQNRRNGIEEITPDSRPPQPCLKGYMLNPDWVGQEFERMMCADTLWSFPLEAQTRTLRVYDPD